jgi:hypothetical protein
MRRQVQAVCATQTAIEETSGSAANGTALLVHNRLRGVMYPTFRMRLLRLIGIGAAAVAQERIPVAIAAAAGGHRLALLQGGKAATAHAGSDVLPAIFIRGRRRRHRDKSQREQRRGHFQKLLHLLVLSVLASTPKPTHGMSGISAPSTSKKSKAILSKARSAIEMPRAAAGLKYDHHVKSGIWQSCRRHPMRRADRTRPGFASDHAFARVVGLAFYRT